MSEYYDSILERFWPIPDAEYYVLSKDDFMSGWGGAKNKVNTCVVPCSTLEEAEMVEQWIKNNKSEQSRVRVTDSKPKLKKNVIYSLCDNWLRFAKEKKETTSCNQ